METILWMCLQGSAMALVVVALRIVAARGYMPWNTVRFLWIIVLARLVLPVHLVSNLTPWKLVDSFVGFQLFAPPYVGEMLNATTSSGVLENAPHAGNSEDLLFSLWVIGVVLFSLRLSVSYVFHIKRLSSAPIVNSAWAETWKHLHPIRRKLALRESPNIGSPLTYGVMHPTIVLPAGWASSIPHDELHYMLEHEYEHVKHFDTPLRIVSAYVSCLYWFNPIVWLSSKLIARDIELACDERVVRELDQTKRISYARTLFNAFERGVSNMSVSLGFAPKRSLVEKRLMLLVKPHSRSRGAASASLAAAFILLLPLAISPVKTVTTTAYSFDIPPAWTDRVETRIDGLHATVYPEGHPELPLISVQVIGPDETPRASTLGYACVASMPCDNLGRIEIWATNYSLMAQGEAWKEAAAANPAYPGSPLEEHLVDLSTGGIAEIEDLRNGVSDGTHGLDFYLTHNPFNLRVA